MAISIRLTVQLPPMKSLSPRSSARSMTWRLTGSRMITASSDIRSCRAASIQYPFQPARRSFGWMSAVYSPPWQEMSTSIAAERSDVERVLDSRDGLADVGSGCPRLGGGEENRIDQIEVPFLAHALHEHGTHHATPTDDAYLHLGIVACSAGSSDPSRGPQIEAGLKTCLYCTAEIRRGVTTGAVWRLSAAAGSTCPRRSGRSSRRERASRPGSP